MNNAPLGLEIYLEPTYFVDSTQPDIVRFVKNTIGNEIDKTKNAIKLYNAVRDGWRYNPNNIPARFCFFDVKNHIGVEKLVELLKTDVLVFHACVDIYLNDNWIKATPAFNEALCKYLGVEPLEFDGVTDSVFQQYDDKGEVFMEYLKEYGTFHDIPHDMFVLLLKQNYPHFFEQYFDKAMTK